MISKILALLKLTRPYNLLMIAGTQIFAYYFLSPQIQIYSLLETPFLFLVLSSVFVAAAGYVINDYMDIKLDLVNKPEKVIVGMVISRRWTMLWHFVFTSIAYILAWQVNRKVFFLVVSCSILLWIYSQFLKKTYLAGNLLVSILTANTILILVFYNPEIMTYATYIYAGFAFLTTLIREIIKDTEDIRGDQQFKSNTIPIALGVRKTKQILINLQLILLILTGAIVSFFEALSFSSNRIYLMFFMYQMIFVVVPMAVMWWLIKVADTKSDFSRLSWIAKLVMLSGVIGMVFWKY